MLYFLVFGISRLAISSNNLISDEQFGIFLEVFRKARILTRLCQLRKNCKRHVGFFGVKTPVVSRYALFGLIKKSPVFWSWSLQWLVASGVNSNSI